MGSAGVEALAVTQDGTRNSRLQALITTRDLAPLFGEHPVGLLSEVGSASSTADLREINKRTRAFALAHLNERVLHRLAEPPRSPGRSRHLCPYRDADGRRCRQRLLVFCRVVRPRGVADEACASSRSDSRTRRPDRVGATNLSTRARRAPRVRLPASRGAVVRLGLLRRLRAGMEDAVRPVDHRSGPPGDVSRPHAVRHASRGGAAAVVGHRGNSGGGRRGSDLRARSWRTTASPRCRRSRSSRTPWSITRASSSRRFTSSSPRCAR